MKPLGQLVGVNAADLRRQAFLELSGRMQETNLPFLYPDLPGYMISGMDLSTLNTWNPKGVHEPTIESVTTHWHWRQSKNPQSTAPRFVTHVITGRDPDSLRLRVVELLMAQHTVENTGAAQLKQAMSEFESLTLESARIVVNGNSLPVHVVAPLEKNVVLSAYTEGVTITIVTPSLTALPRFFLRLACGLEKFF